MTHIICLFQRDLDGTVVEAYLGEYGVVQYTLDAAKQFEDYHDAKDEAWEIHDGDLYDANVVMVCQYEEGKTPFWLLQLGKTSKEDAA